MKVQPSILLLVLFTLIACSPTPEATQTLPSIKPFNHYPNPQNGYGSGPDQLAQPDDVEILPSGEFIVTDVDNHRIQIFTPDGMLKQSIDASTLGIADPEIIPTGISRDAEGFLYITLEGAGLIARLKPDFSLDQFIGRKGKVSADAYYFPENHELLINPQGIIVSAAGDIFVIDMAKDVFRKDGVYNFGFRKFKKLESPDGTLYTYDTTFARTQQVTQVMRKSEGMAISNEQNILFVAEEKPQKDQFGNKDKYRYICAFDLETGRFLDRIYGVELIDGNISSGYCKDSIEGLSVFGNYLFAVSEKDGRVDVYDIDTRERVVNFGVRAPFYCDDESDCVVDGINYNEQNIIAGNAVIHTLNDWRKNELASPDGICVAHVESGQNILAVVDQWNSRVLAYDLDLIMMHSGSTP